MVEKGVHERVRLTKIYEKRREELERQHEEVRLCLEDKKNKVCYSRSLHFYTYQYIRECYWLVLWGGITQSIPGTVAILFLCCKSPSEF
jgi:hypothetical protein